MNKRLLSLVIALVPAVGSAEPLDMNAGLWEVSSEIDLGNGKHASKTQRCATAKELDGSWFATQEGDCKGDQTVTGSTVTWKLACKAEGGEMTSTGKVEYTKTKFSGSAKMTMTIPGVGLQKGTVTMSGRYLGACKK